jgi:hypothetical protein
MRDFENRLDDLFYDINAEIQSLNIDNPDEEYQIGLLQEIKKELNDAHSEFLTYKRNLTKIAN